MWLLQHKNIHKKHLLWLKIFGMCLFFHLIILFWVFCVYRENTYLYAIAVHKKMDYSAPIFFVPMGTSVTTKTVTAKSVAPQPSVAPPSLKLRETSSKTRKNTTNMKTTTIATAPKTTPATKTDVKKIEQKPKIEIKKEEPTVKKDTVVPTTEQAPVKKEIAKSLDIQQNVVPARAIEKETIKATVPHIPKNAQISHNYREVEALRRGAQLQKELIQKWQPPIGVSSDCTCDISFFVNKKGTIENLKMVKSSGVILFDVSARQALFSMKMPQWAYGKPLVINFKQ
jgi:hypothetical protein